MITSIAANHAKGKSAQDKISALMPLPLPQQLNTVLTK